jgi:hypothetical protein
MNSSVPGPVLHFISQSALKQATAWVKKESESAPTARIPSQYASGKKAAKEPELVGARRFGFANRLTRRQ